MKEGSNVTAKSAPQVKFTYNDFMLFPDDGKRHELIEGGSLRDAVAEPAASNPFRTARSRLGQVVVTVLVAEV